CINVKECEKTSKFSKELKLFQSKIVRDKDVTQIVANSCICSASCRIALKSLFYCVYHRLALIAVVAHLEL
ncbi:hypothetical protein, partial [Campylobacter majalis]|uniref:hypothetical protein n=1 Tax=Campylobacter majalis TaxID=2790656 RepID=UPI001E3170B9